MSDDNPLIVALHRAARAETAHLKPAAPMSHMAAAMELHAAWKLTQQQRTVHVGELCQERDGLGYLMNISQGTPIMLWRMLEWGNPYDRVLIEDAIKRHWSDRYDCLVGVKTPEGHLDVVPHETWRLEPYTGPRETPEAA